MGNGKISGGKKMNGVIEHVAITAGSTASSTACRTTSSSNTVLAEETVVPTQVKGKDSAASPRLEVQFATHEEIPALDMAVAKQQSMMSEVSQKTSTPDDLLSQKAPSEAGTSRSGGSAMNAMNRRGRGVGSHRVSQAVKGDDADMMLSRSHSSCSGSVGDIAEIDAESKVFLTKVMSNHFLFSSLETDEYDAIFVHMKKMAPHEGQVIFSEGDSGDSCYFIRSGSYSVTINGSFIKNMGTSQSFGELALLYSMPRSATIVCTEAGEIWRMDRQRFVRCMDTLSIHNNTKALTFFKSDMDFCNLSEDHRKLLASNCSVQRFLDGQEVLREGEIANWVFIIISGKVANEDHTMISGSVVGSANLIYGKRQTSSVWAVGPVICLSLGKHALHNLEPPVVDVFRRNAIKTLIVNPVRPLRKSHLPSMTTDQLHRLIGHFEEATLEAKEIVFEPGDEGQLVFLIDGEAIVSKDADGSSIEHKLEEGMAYGEQELFSRQPMTRFMMVTRKARIHRVLCSKVEHAFGESLGETMKCNEVKRVLSDIFLFKNLKEEQIDRTVRRLQQQRFAANEIVCRQGDPAKHFFLIQEGTILIKKDNKVLRTLGAWDYFGERGLLMDEARSATCQAVESCICLVLGADDFFDIVGMFRKELERRMHLQDLNITIEDLKCKAVVGRGTFGTVRLVCHKLDNNKMYALKGVKKQEVVKGNQQKSIVMEREVNKQCYHPCIMQFIKTFQDKDHVYFLTEFLGGGDLFFAIREIGYLTKLHAQFFSGSIVLALEYLHARFIMYRDLKPENVLLDFNGAAKLVDFGCCKKEVRTHTLIGTPDYMAPEVIKQQGYTCACDWWSLGVMIHEFIVGPLPFGADATDQMSLFGSILKDPLEFPDYITDEIAKSLISGLLERRTEKRLGGSSLGAKEIKAHEYYSDFNWDALGGGFHEPPWKPDADALMKNWEESDGDLVNNVGSSKDFKHQKGMDWAKGF
jgi:cGMP-dependent protein kinase